MRVASADRAAGARMGRASMRREHTTSLARCEGARGSPGAHPGQTCSAHRLAATSRSLTTAALRSVPFARAVVIVRRRKLDGVMETVGLHDPVKTAPSSDRMRARQRYRGDSRYVAAAFIGAFFPPDPLTGHRDLHTQREGREEVSRGLRHRRALFRDPYTGALCVLFNPTAKGNR